MKRCDYHSDVITTNPRDLIGEIINIVTLCFIFRTMPLSSRKEVSKFVHKKLIFRLRRLAIIFIIIFSIVIVEISMNYISLFLAFAGFVLGIVIGLLISKRMHNISWDAETNMAITKMDRIGIALLVIYILFAISRHWIFAHWVHGYALSPFCMSVGAGGMLGRLYNTRQRIRKILKQEGVL